MNRRLPLLLACAGNLLLGLSASHAETAMEKNASNPLAATGQQLAEILNQRDQAAFAQMIDMDALGARVTAGMGLPERDQKDFIAGMKKSRERMAASTMTQIEAKHGQAKLVKTLKKSTGSEQIIRIDYSNAEGESEGYEYLQFEIDNKQKIGDWFVHSQGSRISDFMRRLAASMVKDKNLITTLFGTVQFDGDVLKIVQELSKKMQALDYPGAYNTLQQFPDGYKKTVNWATLQVAVATNLDEAKYRAALQYLADNHGNQPALQFMLIDHYFYQQQYDRMIKALETFERRVVEDGVSNFLKCNGHYFAKDYVKARAACQRSIELEADVRSPYWTLIEIARSTQDAKLALATLSDYEQQFETEFDPDKLVALESYQWLANRDEFKRWAAERR
ncbi:hypothetical protein HPT27_06215 [Permianibacter sp. IMCC34836]|uniref:tetratricopeptide repeat protein n=1 Tax=Permianibacter fluminis TaxID=2738515 RepID=UPI001554C597|nr:hypothetical protein [Permianibacter fluminis]NQD36612.1 hypothetical protein [Permianibacter fluminis]